MCTGFHLFPSWLCVDGKGILADKGGHGGRDAALAACLCKNDMELKDLLHISVLPAISNSLVNNKIAASLQLELSGVNL